MSDNLVKRLRDFAGSIRCQRSGYYYTTTTFHETLVLESVAEIERLQDEIERLRADAARLDWLDKECSEGDGRHIACLSGSLRHAIDAAMKFGC